MPDLESSIRDALRSRSDNTVVLETSLRERRPRRSFAPLLAAAVVLLLALATAAVVTNRGDDSRGRSANGGTGFVGFAWQLLSLRDPHGTVSVPSSLDTRLTFAPNGEVVGSDSVNALSGRYRQTDNGYTVTDVASTAVGSAGLSSDRRRIIDAVTACFYTHVGDMFEPHAAVRAGVDGTTLTLSVAGFQLTYRRTGVKADDPAPSSTSSVTTGARAIVGYRWRVTRIQDDKLTLTLPSTTKAQFTFRDETTVSGDDTVFTFSGRMALTDTGFAPAKVLVSPKGSSDRGTPVSDGIDSLITLDNVEVGAKVTGDTLVLTLGPTRVTLVRSAQVGATVSRS